MGARSAVKIKLRNTIYRCDICGRRMMSAASLRSHQKCVHDVAPKVKTKIAAYRQVMNKVKNQTKKIKNSNVAVNKPNSTTSKKESNIKPKSEPLYENAGKAVPNSKLLEASNVEFECPKCLKIFPVYFTALRHIQKQHCVNSLGEKVSPNSPQLIKPVVKELCDKCDKRIESQENHVCSNNKLSRDNVSLMLSYVCLACKQKFVNLNLFDLHMAGLHSSGVESMFFPTKDEFQIWKQEMEEQTKVTYEVFGSFNTKVMYRCTLLPDEDNQCDDYTSLLCPSTLVVQEFSKGIQVHFYKDHHGHNSEKYVLTDKYKQNSITTMLQNAESSTPIDDTTVEENDLYLEFKKLMESIVLGAAKIDIVSLKVLIGKALGMISILNNYVEDPDSDEHTDKKVIGDSIPWESVQGEKRKLNMENDQSKIEPVTKRFKTRIYQNNSSIQSSPASPMSVLEDSTIKIVNSYSLAQPDMSKALNDSEKSEQVDESRNAEHLSGNKESDDKFSTSKQKVSKTENESKSENEEENGNMKNSKALPTPSFNDSYRDFVTKNIQLQTPSKEKTQNPIGDNQIDSSKVTIKQLSEEKQIGNLLEMKIPQHKQTEKKLSNKKFIAKRLSEKKKVKNLPGKKLSEKISHTKKLDKETVEKKLAKKEVKPNKKPSINSQRFSKPVIVEYEVKEQENDYNLLILKYCNDNIQTYT